MTANPGSLEAARAGCDCSPLHNNAGKKQPEGGWVVRATCKLHGKPEEIPTGIPNATDVLIVLPTGPWTRLRTRLSGWRHRKVPSTPEA